jgi:hypothetical protein
MNETELDLSQEQIKDMEHCLGLDWSNKIYRNYVCFYEPVNYWEDLVSKGLATKRVLKQEGLIGEYHYYYLTELGITIIKGLQKPFREIEDEE